VDSTYVKIKASSISKPELKMHLELLVDTNSLCHDECNDECHDVFAKETHFSIYLGMVRGVGFEPTNPSGTGS